MLGTLVIGLREGLEAALVVGIIAAFLRRNGRSLAPMWIGVGLAVLLSIAVGVGLAVVEQALPQAAQEGMETVIGAVAVVFVTGMIVWMTAHARSMKSGLEQEASEALGRGGARALAVMAFLAVLKEGFETSVFLLATFSVAQSALLAAVGAVVGIAAAVAIGWGIFVGGVRLDLGRFFRVTSAFLILVAAGLVVTALRTAHEAGWLDAGQQRTVDLAWLVTPGSVQSALLTGVLGIPADPRLVEVVGWILYLVPVALFVYWPAAHRPRGVAAARLRLAVAAALAGAALVLAVGYPAPHTDLPASAPVRGSGGSTGTAHLASSGSGSQLVVESASPPDASVTLGAGSVDPHAGVADARRVDISSTSAPSDAPARLTLDELRAVVGGRLVGVDAVRSPGPYDARWSTVTATSVWTSDGVLLDARSTSTTVVTVSGGGLGDSRTLTAAERGSTWRIDPDYVARAASGIAALESAQAERRLWALELPIALALAVLFTGAAGVRALRRASLASAAPRTPPAPRGAGPRPAPAPRETYAAR